MSGTLLVELARTSAAVAATRARSEKIGLLATCLGGLRADEVSAAVTFLSGTMPRIGVGWASLRDLPPPASVASLEILDVNRDLRARRLGVRARLAGVAQAGPRGVVRSGDGARAAVPPRDPPR